MSPAICLNMIVRNEAHVVAEVLEAAAPYISSWVIVDTGSDDGTQDVICGQLARLGIPGELHERPWRDFGHNRTEALALAQGHGDYIWVIDADDLVVGRPEFSGLSADVYYLRTFTEGYTHWRPQVFRDGLAVRYVGVVHEYPTWNGQCDEASLDGDYHIEARTVGARSLDPQKYARDAEILLTEVQRNPSDTRSVFYLAQSYFDARDFASARTWYARRTEMGGFDEEVYHALYRLAVSMHELGEPWPDVQDAYLRAWEFRPSRAEPLYCIAHAYRTDARHRLGHLFARQAGEVPFPADDQLWVQADVYGWRALDEQIVCASRIGDHVEAFTLCRQLLARPDVPEEDRQRIAGNRDFSVPAMLDAAVSYPEALARSLVGDVRDAEVAVLLGAGPDLAGFERGFDSFLCCCRDIGRVGRFLAFDDGLSAGDRVRLAERYPFVEFTDPGSSLRAQAGGRYWLRLGSGWRFFAPENYITRLTAVLVAEPQVFQVGGELRRCGDADRCVRGRGGGAPVRGYRPLCAGRRGVAGAGDVRHGTVRPVCRAAGRHPRRGALHRRGLTGARL